MTIDVVIPARNEATTVAAVVEACLGCAYARQVIVVDDGSTDGTADMAAPAGATLVHRARHAGRHPSHQAGQARPAGGHHRDRPHVLGCHQRPPPRARALPGLRVLPASADDRRLSGGPRPPAD